MPLGMIFNYSVFSMDFIQSLVQKNCYNTRFAGLRSIKANNKRGERSLLCTGVLLCNKYLSGGEIGTLSRPLDGLASRLWSLE